MSEEYQSGTSEASQSEQAPSALSDDDRKAVQQWFNSLLLQDARYDSKVILKLGALAIYSEEWRSKLVSQPDASFEGLDPDLKHVKLKFYDNSVDTLHVVLPPRPENRPPELRELLSSRTSAEFFGSDDANFGDLSNGGPYPSVGDLGDASHDSGVITLPK